MMQKYVNSMKQIRKRQEETNEMKKKSKQGATSIHIDEDGSRSDKEGNQENKNHDS